MKNSGNNSSSSKNSQEKFSSNSKLLDVKLKFPDPCILQELEYASEGAANKVLELLEKEQQSRIEKEKQFAQNSFKIYSLAQIYGFLSILAIIIASTVLGIKGHEDIAIYLSISGFSAVAFSTVFNIFYLRKKKTSFSRSYSQNKYKEGFSNKKNNSALNSKPYKKTRNKNFRSARN